MVTDENGNFVTNANGERVSIPGEAAIVFVMLHTVRRVHRHKPRDHAPTPPFGLPNRKSLCPLQVTEGPALTSTSDSDDSGGGGIVIAMSIIIALLLVVVGIMCYRQQAADGQKDGQRAVQTFDNPA